MTVQAPDLHEIDDLEPTSNVALLQDLLSWELESLTAYDRALGSPSDSPAKAAILLRRQDHAEAVTVLRERIRHYGGVPEYPAEIWETTTRADSADDLLGELQERELGAIGLYEEALIDLELDTDCKDLIRYRLLPRSRANAQVLARLRPQADHVLKLSRPGGE
jgi:hypothetical protein